MKRRCTVAYCGIKEQKTYAQRLSLAQEIAETLKVRNHYYPKNYREQSSDLIGAVGMALDKAEQSYTELVEKLGKIASELERPTQPLIVDLCGYYARMIRRALTEAKGKK